MYFFFTCFRLLTFLSENGLLNSSSIVKKTRRWWFREENLIYYCSFDDKCVLRVQVPQISILLFDCLWTPSSQIMMRRLLINYESLAFCLGLSPTSTYNSNKPASVNPCYAPWRLPFPQYGTS